MGLKELRNLLLSADSATTRRYIAEAFSTVMIHQTTHDESQIAKMISESLRVASSALKLQPLKSSAEVHGGALLGGISIKLLHFVPALEGGDSFSTARQVMTWLSDGLLSSDDSVSNFCCDGLVFSCTYDQTPMLHEMYVTKLPLRFLFHFYF